ncbi:tetratricopeptide repeat protein [Streptomyces sp. ICBB 8177]|uniref:tetratricopeptide repeat protein n=1 Tax=Streptomyces sp. ICBB 8177 TaxID=563922 RepID=UPI001305343F|nr:tetratricopeptide repeat protein [Streptomyces sp. ICBB 8177]
MANAPLDGLIRHDDAGRMVPVDAEAVEHVVRRLLDDASAPCARLREAGVGLIVLGRYEQARTVLRRALALADERQAVAVHINLGDAHRYDGDLDGAERHYRDALRTAREVRPAAVHFCLQHLGKQRVDQGRIAEAVALLREALALRETLGDPALVMATREALRLAVRGGGPGLPGALP